jgi:hypothetical protein
MPETLGKVLFDTDLINGEESNRIYHEVTGERRRSLSAGERSERVVILAMGTR